MMTVSETAGPTRHTKRFVRPRVLGGAIMAALLWSAIALSSGVAAQGYYVDGSSMVPALQSGEVLLVNKAAVWRVTSPVPEEASGVGRFVFGGPRRGDVVVFQSPTSPDRDFVKRIIGLPGDTVLIETGQVFVNGAALDEPYLQYRGSYTYPSNHQPLQVPGGAYFVLGDNRAASADSHQGWFVPEDHLRGQVLTLPWTAPGA